MSNPFFEALGSKNSINFAELLEELKANPLQFILKHKFHIPPNLANDPFAMAQYLVNSGQVNQNVYNNAYNNTYAMMSRTQK